MPKRKKRPPMKPGERRMRRPSCPSALSRKPSIRRRAYKANTDMKTRERRQLLGLTQAQSDRVMQLAARGMRPDQIASHMGISVRATIELVEYFINDNVGRFVCDSRDRSIRGEIIRAGVAVLIVYASHGGQTSVPVEFAVPMTEEEIEDYTGPTAKDPSPDEIEVMALRIKWASLGQCV